MDKERILLRSFISIRTYAILAVFAAILAVLLFSAGCRNAAAKSSCGEPVGHLCRNVQTAVEDHAAYQDDAKQEIKNWNQTWTRSEL